MALWGCDEDLGERSVGAHAEACGSCHSEVAADHRASRHAQTRTSDVFRALRERAEEDLGAAGAAFCDGCHVPPHGDSDGLTCVTCHAAVGNEGTENGKLVLDLEGPVRGPTGRADDAPHAVEKSGFLMSSDLCGTCHDAKGPAGFSETPYLAWKSSPAAEEGVTCKECHMRSSPGRAGAGAGSHRIVGFDDLPPDDEHGAGAELAARVLTLDIHLQKEATSSPTIEVVVHHEGTGHPFPTGATFLRELWVSLEVDGEDGVRRFQSGALDDEGRVTSDDGSVRWLSTRTLRGNQRAASPTRADELVHHAIGPEESAVLTFSLPVPDGPWTAHACVRLRRYRPDMLSALQLDPEASGPVVDVTCVDRDFGQP